MRSDPLIHKATIASPVCVCVWLCVCVVVCVGVWGICVCAFLLCWWVLEWVLVCVCVCVRVRDGARPFD